MKIIVPGSKTRKRQKNKRKGCEQEVKRSSKICQSRPICQNLGQRKIKGSYLDGMLLFLKLYSPPYLCHLFNKLLEVYRRIQTILKCSLSSFDGNVRRHLPRSNSLIWSCLPSCYFALIFFLSIIQVSFDPCLSLHPLLNLATNFYLHHIIDLYPKIWP